MNTGAVSAWHYATRQPVEIHWVDGVITRILPAAGEPPPGSWIAPALLDLQINGFAGVDFQSDTLVLADLFQAVEGLLAAGCSRFYLTLITDAWEKMLARLRHLRKWRGCSPQLKRAIAGWHLEGPFLSSEPGYCGAHPGEVMLDPTAEHIRGLREAVEGDPVLLTLAPERPGALDAIALAVSFGMRVSLGHTNASAEILRKAVEAGASGFTHLGNACPQQLDRHDNILWRVLDTPGLTLGLIPDRIHVSPALFRLVHRAVKAESIYYTTDAMAAAGAPPGRYSIGRVVAEVGPDQVVREPGKSNYAGSALRPIDGVFAAAEMLGGPWQAAWDAFSRFPGRFIGLPRNLEVGEPADFCLLRVSADQKLEGCRVIVGGEDQ
jgi:N-acetylglucosamine-6-phosphate deacetylase